MLFTSSIIQIQACKWKNDKEFRRKFNNSSPQFTLMWHAQTSILHLVALQIPNVLTPKPHDFITSCLHAPLLVKSQE